MSHNTNFAVSRNGETGMKMRSFKTSCLVAAMGTVLGLANPALAQVVRGPSIGGARAGASTQGQGASVPLPFASERTGLPIPVNISFQGGGSVGNAGLGWNMALSYVHFRDDEIGQLPRADGLRRKRVVLSLGGSSVDLVSVNSEGTRFTPRDASQVGELFRETADRWVYLEGSVRYIFVRIPSLDSNQFYLQEVRGQASGSVVTFNYDVETITNIPGVRNPDREEGDPTVNPAYEVRLASISYNYKPGNYSEASCAKNRVEFSYGKGVASLPADAVLSIAAPSPTSLAGAPVVTKVLTGVEFKSSDSASECGGTMVRAAGIDFVYTADADTGLPRLTQTKAKGRQGIGDTAMPLQLFTYGPQVGAIKFEAEAQRALSDAILPAGMRASFADTKVSILGSGFSGTNEQCSDRFALFDQLQMGSDGSSIGYDSDRALQFLSASVYQAAGGCIWSPAMTFTKTWATFTDFTGDGRPDWVYRENDTGPLKIAVNRSTGSALVFDAPINLFSSANFDVGTVNDGSLPLHLTATSELYDSGDTSGASVTSTWVRMQDFNGDGRLDIVDARYPMSKWIVYINAPSSMPATAVPGDFPTGDAPIKWMRTEVDISTAQTSVAANYGATGLISPTPDGWIEAPNSWSGGTNRLPLETVFSGATMNLYQAYMFDESPDYCEGHDPRDDGWYKSCAWAEVGDFLFSGTHYSNRTASFSITAHRVEDANADGYPDVTFVGMGDVSHSFEPLGVHNFTIDDATICVSGSTAAGDPINTDQCPSYPMLPWNIARDNVPAWWHYNNYTQTDPFPGEMVSRGSRVGLDASEFTDDVFILYNVAGAALGAHAIAEDTFKDELFMMADSGCTGLETWRNQSAGISSAPEARLSHMSCAIRDVNSDGLLDSVAAPGAVELEEPNPICQTDPNNAACESGVRSIARLGNGEGFTQVKIEVPASSTIGSLSFQTECEGIGRRHPAYLADNAAPATTSHFIASYLTFSDVNGDGLVDALGAMDGDLQWDNPMYAGRLGAGTADINILKPLSLTSVASHGSSDEAPACDSGFDITTMLLDVNGDARVDQASIQDGKLRVLQLKRDTAVVGNDDVGLLAQQRLIQVADGYGAGVLYKYTNAKNDNTTVHNVPFAEIMLASSEPVGEPLCNPNCDPDLPQQEPTYFAYGNNSMVYSVLAQRFVPTGYILQSTLRGKTVAGGNIRGVGSVQQALGLSTAFGSSSMAEAAVRLGQPRKEFTYEGQFSSAWDLLSLDESNEDLLRSKVDYQHFVAAVPSITAMLQPAEQSGDQCPHQFFPYGGGEAFEENAPTLHCSSRMSTYVKSTESESGLFLGEGDSDNRTVKTKVTIEEADARGQALKIRNSRDLTDATDDMCTVMTYAEPAASSPYAAVLPGFDAGTPEGRLLGRMNQLLGVVQEAKTTDCNNRVLTKVVHEYDEVDSTGYVLALPRRSKTFFEKADGTFTSEGEAIVSALSNYNVYGQLESSDSTVVEGLSELTGTPVTLTSHVEIDYDPGFSLHVVGTETTASGDPAVIRSARTVDPVTGQTTSSTDADGAISRTYYDGYGRPTRMTVAHPDYNAGAEYITQAIEYMGDQAASHTGRQVRTKQFGKWKLLSAYSPLATAPGAGEQWTETMFNPLGQVKWNEHQLGSTYGGKIMVSGRMRYDSLGRVTLARRAYNKALGNLSGSPHRYATHIKYPDYSTDPVCQFDADDTTFATTTATYRLPTAETVNGRTDYRTPALSNVAQFNQSCSFTSYEQNGMKQVVLHDSTWSPTRTASPMAVASVQEFNARGELVSSRTWDGTSETIPASQQAFEYELGRPTATITYRQPSLTSPAEGLEQTVKYDGLGRIVEAESPLAEPVRMFYDKLGRLLYSEQADETSSLRRFAKRYDGFGRVFESGVLLNDYTFDTSDSSYTLTTFIPDGVNGVGKVDSIQRTGAPLEEVAYDEFARPYISATVEGDRVVEQQTEFDGPGRVWKRFSRINDGTTQSAEEVTVFMYDTANRLSTVQYGLAPTGHQTYMNQTLDEFARPITVRYGSGTGSAGVESYSYLNTGGMPLSLSLLGVSRTLPGEGRVRTVNYSLIPAASVAVNHDQGWVKMTVTEKTGSTINSNVIHDFDYDTLFRLKSFKQTEGPSATPTTVTQHEKYRYDGIGNMAYIVNELNQSNSLAMVPDTENPARLCAWSVGDYSSPALGLPASSNTDCTFEYDLSGNVTSYVQPYTNVGISLLRTKAGEVSTVSGGPWTTGYSYGGSGGVSQRRFNANTYRLLGHTEERPNGSGGTLVERALPGGMRVRGDAATGVKLFEGFGGGVETLSSSTGVEGMVRMHSPLGRRTLTEGALPSETNGSLYEWNSESVCGYNNTCGYQLYRAGTGVYDPYLGRSM